VELLFKYGDNDKNIDGTACYMTGGADFSTTKSIIISIAASVMTFDALKPGQSFVDPVFKTLKLDFSAGMSVSDNDSTRETLQIVRTADTRLQLKGLLADSSGNAQSLPFC